mgnify:CR=1 FL=1
MKKGLVVILALFLVGTIGVFVDGQTEVAAAGKTITVGVNSENPPWIFAKDGKMTGFEADLVEEFAKRAGDPNTGGATRAGLVTAYRQDALRCAAYLAAEGPSKGAEVARATGVATATRLMADNHYGWFVRVARGVYGLSAAGRQGLTDWAGSWEG